MGFKPGQSGNPLGRPRGVDPRSPDLATFCKEHRDDIKRVGEIALERAVKDQEPWAIKLCMEYFYPKPGTFVAISKEESKEVSLKVENFMNALPYEDQQTFLRLWMKSKKGIPVSSIIDQIPDECIEASPTINNSVDREVIYTITKSPEPS